MNDSKAEEVLTPRDLRTPLLYHRDYPTDGVRRQPWRAGVAANLSSSSTGEAIASTSSSCPHSGGPDPQCC